MPYSKAYENAYEGLPEALAEHYSELSFDNHCYLRIALDELFKAKWDTKIKRPAYKHLSDNQLVNIRRLLNRYKNDKQLLLQHNKQSLAYRSAWKKQNQST